LIRGFVSKLRCPVSLNGGIVSNLRRPVAPSGNHVPPVTGLVALVTGLVTLIAVVVALVGGYIPLVARPVALVACVALRDTGTRAARSARPLGTRGVVNGNSESSTYRADCRSASR